MYSIKPIGLVLLVFAFLSCSKKEKHTGSILIINPMIYDGTGKDPFQSDVLLRDDRIEWLGNSRKNKILADTIIDAMGMVLSPGFIDIHAHGDPLETPEFENFLRMGVTSIALGMDGSSPKCAELENWEQRLNSHTQGVNIFPFIGHGTLREECGIGLNTSPDSSSIDSMLLLLEQAMNWGSWGLSMGLEYFPGYFSPSYELEALAKAVGKNKGIISAHIRNEDDIQLDSSLREMISLAKYCHVNISHLKSVYGKGKARGISILNSLLRQPSVSADIYPYTASYTGIGILFPDWAKIPKTYKQIKSTRRKELEDHIRRRISIRNGPSATLFGSGPYTGKTLADLQTEYGMSAEDVLIDLIGPWGASAAYFIMDEELQNEMIIHPSTAIASDGSPTMYHPRGHGTFAKIIEEFVIRDSLMTLQSAINKMTLLPAQIMGIEDRGKIASGYQADLLIFDPSKIRNKASFQAPHENTEGMTYVIVNGKICLSPKQFVPEYGKLIKKK